DKRVDFPAPLGPISPVTVPVVAVKETLSTIRFPSISMETSVTFSIILYTCSLFHHAAQQDEKCGAADERGQTASREACERNEGARTNIRASYQQRAAESRGGNEHSIRWTRDSSDYMRNN